MPQYVLLEPQTVVDNQVGAFQLGGLHRRQTEGVRVGVGLHQDGDVGFTTDDLPGDVAEDVGGDDDVGPVAAGGAGGGGSGCHEGEKSRDQVAQAGDAHPYVLLRAGAAHRPVSAMRTGLMSRSKERAMRRPSL